MDNRMRMIFVAATIALCAGCARGTAAESGSGTSSTPSTPAATCTDSPKVTEADNGKTVCVTVNGHVDVRLNGTKDSLWSGVNEDSDALTRDQHPKISVPLGVTEASYVAKHAGTVHLKSTRPVCPSTAPGTMRCGAVEGFSVTVEVR